MIKNIDTTFFRKILELDKKIYEDFLNFVTEIIDLKNNITYNDFLIFKSSLFSQLANNDYSFENIGSVIREKANKSSDATILKLYSYTNHLNYLNDKVDVLKYYIDINNVDERIFPYSNVQNIGYVTLQNVFEYIAMIGTQGKKDDIALSILLDKVSLKEAEKYYDQLIERLENFSKKYKDVIKELEHKKLMNKLFEYLRLSTQSKGQMFHQMIEYLKNNNLNKNKIYMVLKKVEELQIDQLNIDNESKLSSEIHNVHFSEFQKAYYKTKKGETEIIENGYVGTYIYTDGTKNWLLQTKSANAENNYEDTYTLEINNFKYILFNDKQIDFKEDCFGPFFDPYLDRITELQIYDFDIDITTLPTYEELNSFKIMPQIDFIHVQEKTNAVDTILQIECIIKNVKKLLASLKKLQNIIGTEKNTSVLSQIKNLEVLIEQMESMKSTKCAEYFKQGITELEKLKTLKNDKNIH